MIVYWIGCLSSVFVAWLGTNRLKGKRHSNTVAFFSMLPLALISALRYKVGMDYMYTYVPYFNQVQNQMVNDQNRLEILYHLINRVAVMLGGSYELVFILCAVIFFVPLTLQIFRDSPCPALSIFLLVTMGYYFVSFNAVRQMMGCAIALYAVRYIEERRLKPFLLCMLIAAGFHKSCIVFLAMYWLGRIRLKPAIALLATAAAMVLGNKIAMLLRYLISLTPYGVYFSSKFDTGETAYVMLAINMVLLLFASLCYQDTRKFRIYYNLQVLAVIATAYSGKVVLFLRMLWLFGLPSVISLPMTIENVSGERNKKLIMSGVVLLYFLYMLYTVGLRNSNTVLPFQTILSRW